MTRTFLIESGLPLYLWAELVNTSCYLLNRTPHSDNITTTPWFLWHKQVPSFKLYRRIGCLGYVLKTDQKRKQDGKLKSNTIQGFLTGYEEQQNSWRLYIPGMNTVTVSTNVVFNEDIVYNDRHNISNEITIEELINIQNTELESHVNNNNLEESLISKREQLLKFSFITQYADEFTQQEIGFISANSKTLQVVVSNAASILPSSDTPTTIKEAKKLSDWPSWDKAISSEWKSLHENQTFTLTTLPTGRKALDNKFVFSRKYNKDGSLNKYKARLVIKGYSQTQGIDYEETFAPVVKFTTLRLILAMAAEKDWELDHLDFVTAFLNGDLEEEIYMKQPVGLEEKGKEQLVYKLHRSLYGLKQAPRQWNKKLKEFLINIGFQQSQSDHGLFIKRNGNDIIIITLLV
jgi:hypothetical protein